MSSIVKEIVMHVGQAVAVEQRDGNKFGVTLGLRLTHFLNELFYANYQAGKTDEELTADLMAEYPARTQFQTITAYRSYFNSGLHGFGWGQPLDPANRLRAYKAPKAAPPAPPVAPPQAAAPKPAAPPAAPAAPAPAAPPAPQAAAPPCRPAGRSSPAKAPQQPAACPAAPPRPLAAPQTHEHKIGYEH